jgi:hypothetical protein
MKQNQNRITGSQEQWNDKEHSPWHIWTNKKMSQSKLHQENKILHDIQEYPKSLTNEHQMATASMTLNQMD